MYKKNVISKNVTLLVIVKLVLLILFLVHFLKTFSVDLKST
jgi:hypothetical protein